MSKSTISTFQLFEMFPTAESARIYLESRLWPDGPFCPECKSRERIGKQPKVGFYRCNACSLDFTIRTGHDLRAQPHSPAQVALRHVPARNRTQGHLQPATGKEIGVTQKSAWFMLQRLREACGSGDDLDKLRGIVEVDECFIGGKERNKHEHKKLKAGRGSGRQDCRRRTQGARRTHRSDAD